MAPFPATGWGESFSPFRQPRGVFMGTVGRAPRVSHLPWHAGLNLYPASSQPAAPEARLKHSHPVEPREWAPGKPRSLPPTRGRRGPISPGGAASGSYFITHLIYNNLAVIINLLPVDPPGRKGQGGKITFPFAYPCIIIEASRANAKSSRRYGPALKTKIPPPPLCQRGELQGRVFKVPLGKRGIEGDIKNRHVE